VDRVSSLWNDFRPINPPPNALLRLARKGDSKAKLLPQKVVTEKQRPRKRRRLRKNGFVDLEADLESEDEGKVSADEDDEDAAELDSLGYAKADEDSDSASDAVKPDARKIEARLRAHDDRLEDADLEYARKRYEGGGAAAAAAASGYESPSASPSPPTRKLSRLKRGSDAVSSPA
jgi:hypothetical protein